jgi:energy-coupling factor transporter ATP-binding protein EcfA2
MDASGIVLSIDPMLIHPQAPPKVLEDPRTGDDDGDAALSSEVEWLPLPVEFRLRSLGDGKELDAESGYEWLPESPERVALLWLLTAASDAPSADDLLTLPHDHEVSSWIRQVSSRQLSLQSAVSGRLSPEVSGDPVIGAVVELRTEFRRSARASGISRELLQSSFDKWAELLENARAGFVPDGRTDERISALFVQDMLSVGRQATLMLPSHPFRLRWLARYLSKSEELAIKSLAGDLPLNPQNERLYLDWIEQLSPHQQPPVTCTETRDLVFPAGESGWTEEYLSLAGLQGFGEDSPTDAASVGEIAEQITSYLAAHPYKADGLRVLMVLQRGGRLPADIVKAVRRGEWKAVPFHVHVLAPQHMFDQIVSAFQELPTEDRMSSGKPLFPPLQLQLHEWRPGAGLEGAIGLEYDLAIVPRVLNDQIRIQENTEPEVQRQGRFDPLLDKPTYVYGGTSGGVISVSIRPRSPDPSLEAWSTLAVRHHRCRAVSPQQPENTDFVELQINFDETARLFNELHTVAHWVITLERHIRREQIETLEVRPDILTVKEGVGAARLYTLIVSSNSGSRFIIDRLQRKLVNLLPAQTAEPPAVGRELAKRIYDDTRLVAPRLVLRAMGLSRVTEEILGLMVARRVANTLRPARPGDGVVVWVSLDEHPEWFRGASGTRADLLRITIEREDDEYLVSVLVVEGKLRQTYDPHGVEQVASTLRLIKGMLPEGVRGHETIDARLWREELLSAMETVNPAARFLRGPALEELEGGRYSLPEALRESFREGDFRVRELSGLFSICRYDRDGADEIVEEDGVHVVRSFRNRLFELVSGDTETPDASLQRTVREDVSTGGDHRSPSEEEGEAIGAVEEGPPGGKASGQAGAGAPDDRRRMSQAQLQARYQSILDKLGEFGVDVGTPDDPALHFVEGPASVLYRVRPGQGVDPKRVNEKADALKLSLALSEDQSIRFSIDRGFVTIDVPKTPDERYFVYADQLWARWQRPDAELCAPLGEDRFGEVVELNFSSANSPHLLIGGTTGSGKSEALNTVLAGLVRHYSAKQLRLLLIDPKGTELQQFSDTPHVEGDIGWDEADAKELLDRGVKEMQSRYAIFRERNTRSLQEYNAVVGQDGQLPWWLIVLDEYADLTSEPETKRQIEASLKRLAQKARAAGIHVIIATQKPSAEVISTNLRSNLPAQLALRVRSATESRVIMEEAGAESLNGKGDAFLKSEGRLTRVQCAKT